MCVCVFVSTFLHCLFFVVVFDVDVILVSYIIKTRALDTVGVSTVKV